MDDEDRCAYGFYVALLDKYLCQSYAFAVFLHFAELCERESDPDRYVKIILSPKDSGRSSYGVRKKYCASLNLLRKRKDASYLK